MLKSIESGLTDFGQTHTGRAGIVAMQKYLREQESQQKDLSDEEEPEIDRRFIEMRARMELDKDGQPWFYRMRQGRGKDTGLFGWFGEQIKDSGVMIAKDMAGQEKEYKMFTWFPSHEAFFAWVDKNVLPEDRHFYEVIGGTTSNQRPYFDIDMSLEQFEEFKKARAEHELPGWNDDTPQGFIEYLGDFIARELASTYSLPKERTDYFIFQSFYEKEGKPTKYSFHIVFNGVYFESHEEMRIFGQTLKERANVQSSGLGEIIDDIWYRSRQFRVLDSCKLGKGSVARKQFLVGERVVDTSTHSPVNKAKTMVTKINPGDRLLPNLLYDRAASKH